MGVLLLPRSCLICFSPLSTLRASFGRSRLEGQEEDHQRAGAPGQCPPCSRPPANEAVMLMAPTVQPLVPNFFLPLAALPHPSCSPPKIPSSPSSTPKVTPSCPLPGSQLPPPPCVPPLGTALWFFAADGLLLFPLSPSLIRAGVSSANRWVMGRNNTRF